MICMSFFALFSRYFCSKMVYNINIREECGYNEQKSILICAKYIYKIQSMWYNIYCICC